MGTLPDVDLRILHPRSGGWRGRSALQAPDAPDLIHLHGHGLLAGAVLRRFPGVPLLAHVHQFAEGSGAPAVLGLHTLLRARQRSVLARAWRVVAPSMQAAGKVRSLVPEADVRVVPTGLAPEIARQAVALRRLGKERPSHEPPKVLFVGRRTGDKSYPTFAKLAATHPEAQWVAMGKGRGAGHGVTLLAHGPHAEVARQMAAADVLLNPSLLETQGLAALEALSLGTPVVAPEGSAQAELLRPGVSGHLYDPHDLDEAWAAVVAAAALPREGVRAPAGFDESDLQRSMHTLYQEALMAGRDRTRRSANPASER